MTPVSYKVVCDGASNALRFSSYGEARHYEFDLGMRWFGFKESHVEACDDPVTAVIDTRPIEIRGRPENLLHYSSHPGLEQDLDACRRAYVARAISLAGQAIAAWDNPCDEPPAHERAFARRLDMSRLPIGLGRDTLKTSTIRVVANHERTLSMRVESPSRAAMAFAVHSIPMPPNAPRGARAMTARSVTPLGRFDGAGPDSVWTMPPVVIPPQGAILVFPDRGAGDEQATLHVRPTDLAQWLAMCDDPMVSDEDARAVADSLAMGDLPVARDLAFHALGKIKRADRELPSDRHERALAVFATSITPAERKRALIELANTSGAIGHWHGRSKLAEILQAIPEIEYLVGVRGLLRRDRAGKVSVTERGLAVHRLITEIPSERESSAHE